MLAVAYDVMIPGCYTKTTNNLRLWESKPKRGFDLNSFNGEHSSLERSEGEERMLMMVIVAGDYERAVESSNSASAITSVLYPNDNTCVSSLPLSLPSFILTLSFV